MNFNEYQKQAIQTVIYPVEGRITYPALGLVNEAGEVAGKVKKRIRGDGVPLEEIGKEIGDVLWYCAVLAHDLGMSLDDIAKQNLDKLPPFSQTFIALRGNGDNR